MPNSRVADWLRRPWLIFVILVAAWVVPAAVFLLAGIASDTSGARKGVIEKLQIALLAGGCAFVLFQALLWICVGIRIHMMIASHTATGRIGVVVVVSVNILAYALLAVGSIGSPQISRSYALSETDVSLSSPQQARTIAVHVFRTPEGMTYRVAGEDFHKPKDLITALIRCRGEDSVVAELTFESGLKMRDMLAVIDACALAECSDVKVLSGPAHQDEMFSE